MTTAVGQQIGAAEVLTRAQYWNAHPPPTGYDQGGSTPDPSGRRYRSDCSGFVSMCWRLAMSATSADIGGYTAKPVAKSALRGGDVLCASSALNNGSGHVVLFDHWVDAAQNAYFGHDFGSGAVPKHRVFPYPYFPRDRRVFLPYSYPGLVGSAASSGGFGGGGGGGIVIGIPTRTVYDTPGTYWWNKPETGTYANFILVGGGGCGAPGNEGFHHVPDPLVLVEGDHEYTTWGDGGSGGGGGEIIIATIPLDQLDATDNQVTVGRGGSYNHPDQDSFDNPPATPIGEGSYFAFTQAGGGEGPRELFLGGIGANNTSIQDLDSSGIEGLTGVRYGGADGDSAPQGQPRGAAGGAAGVGAPSNPLFAGHGGGSAGTDGTYGPVHVVIPDDGGGGLVIIETGGDRDDGGGATTAPPGSPPSDVGAKPVPTWYLRMTQRNDGLGVQRHPRLTGTASNGPTSVQSARSTRLGAVSNTYR